MRFEDGRQSTWPSSEGDHKLDFANSVKGGLRRWTHFGGAIGFDFSRGNASQEMEEWQDLTSFNVRVVLARLILF